MKRFLAHAIVMMVGNIPGIPRPLQAEYLRAALTEINPMHPDVPRIVIQLNKLEAQS